MPDLNHRTEMEKLEFFAQRKPEHLLKDIEKVRQLKKDGADIPEELVVLAQYVRSIETLSRKGFPDYFLLDDYSLSYSTPQKYAAYRARKIASYYPGIMVADISCGAGAQLLELCKELSAIGIEKDEVRSSLARINLTLAHYRKEIPFLPKIITADALSPEILPEIKEYGLVLCDSWRERKIYSPDLNQLKDKFTDKFIVYEFRPLETPADIITRYPFVFGRGEIEYFGEGERSSRLTVYLGRGNKVSFIQDDEYATINLSYSHERIESAEFQAKEKIVSGFPTHEFGVLNRGMVDNFFVSLFTFNVFGVDKKRFLCEINPPNKDMFKRIFAPELSSTDIKEVVDFLNDNYEDYNLSLRFEIESEQYWKFMQDNHLVQTKDSKNRFSLFKHKNTYHLAEEK